MTLCQMPPLISPDIPQLVGQIWHVCHMQFTLAELVVSDALVNSYPTWTDENGTNVNQLAEIAVRALAGQGLLTAPEEGDLISVTSSKPAISR